MTADIKKVAQAYIDAGWAVVPVPHRQKAATGKWNETTYGPADFQPDDNIALKCGTPSGGRVDVDLESPEAVACARILLPATGLVHGRTNHPESHWWYLSSGATPLIWGADTGRSDRKNTLVEIRADGGYTMAPPSVHPNGDVLTWASEGQPLVIAFDDLRFAGRNVAIATLVGLRWPGSGARHHMVGHLAGFLCRCQLDERFILKIVEAAATAAKDSDVHDRIVFARNTIEKYKQNPTQPLTGGPKLADILGADVVDRLRTWLLGADEAEKLRAIEEMNRKHFVVRLGAGEVIATEEKDEVLFQREKDLKLRYRNEWLTGTNAKGQPVKRPLIDAWLESPARRSYRKVAFAPPPLQCDPQDYNLWTGFAVTPHSGGCPRFQEHLHEVICSGNDQHYAYLIKLLGYTVRCPGRQSEVATVLRGGAGTGKGIFVRALLRAFGRHGVHLSKPDQLVGRFNASLSGKVIVFADEAFWAGNKKEHGELKRLITEPTLQIERKFVDVAEEPNCVHLFVATNEDRSIPAMLKERRYFALEVANKRQGQFRYFERLQDELDNGGLAAFLYSLLHWPVSADEIRKVPKTTELRVQQEQSLSYELQWWHDCLNEGRIRLESWPQGAQIGRFEDVWPQNRVKTDDLYNCYVEYMHKLRQPPKTKIGFGAVLGKFMWNTGKAEDMRFGRTIAKGGFLRTLRDARNFFDHEMGTSFEWSEDEQGTLI